MLKIRVDKLTFNEFSEYVNSTFARNVRYALTIFMSLSSLGILIGIALKWSESSIQTLFWCFGIILFMIILTNISIKAIYNKSGLGGTLCRYSFDESGMDINMGKLKGDLSWEYVKKVKETKNLIIINVQGSTFILPKRCCDADELLNLLKVALPEDKISEQKYKEKDRDDSIEDRRKGNNKTKRNNGQGKD
ncbi:MAG: YcxB family protein [Bacillota bacterium]|nr:YcxB family protein [Bacillota bacterium]